LHFRANWHIKPAHVQDYRFSPVTVVNHALVQTIRAWNDPQAIIAAHPVRKAFVG
jgi:hypothetical protein